MKLIIPNSKEIELKTLILDLNGTLTVKGELMEGVEERIRQLAQKDFKIVLFSGDTRGNGQLIADKLGIELIQTATGDDKKKAVQKLDPNTCVTIGNGLIDLQLFKEVRLSIVTIQAEGAHTKTLLESDIVVISIVDALDLLIDEKSLIATLRP